MAASAAEILAARAVLRKSIIGFTKATFPRYDPAPFHWRIGALLDDVVHCGRARRFMIFMPPRHGKSELFSIRLPAYFLGNFPDCEVMHASYGASLSHGFSRQARNLLLTAEYQAIFPGIFPAKDSRSVKMWNIEGKRGAMYSAGVGGSFTGKGAHLGLLDDLIKDAKEANSEVIRTSRQEWYQQVFRNRVYPGGSIGLVQTRWHLHDVAGFILEQSKGKQEFAWELLVLPAWDEVTKTWLWPERYSQEEYEDLKHDSGKYGWAALFQQNPMPYGGGPLKREFFRILALPDLPKLVRIVMGVDLATSTKTMADFSAGCPVGIDRDGKIYFLPPYHAQAEWPDVREALVVKARMGGISMLGVEKVAFQAAAVQDLRRILHPRGIAVVESPADTDKLTRVNDWAPIAATSGITLVEDGTGWTEKFLKEAEEMPLGKHDDLVDGYGHGMATLRRKEEAKVRRRGER